MFRLDRRNLGPQESSYKRDLANSDEKESKEYDGIVVENGKEYRIPYRMIREVTFTDLNKDELIDFEHSARLQYRLLLNDAVLRAKVEFAKLSIVIMFNPDDSDNYKEKISLDGIKDFLASEGVHVEKNKTSLREVDYYEEIYKTQFDPISVRERPPYSYTKEQWKGMKSGWYRKVAETDKKKLDNYHRWQDEYAELHKEDADLKKRDGNSGNSVLGGILHRKKPKDDDKGFWFHGA